MKTFVRVALGLAALAQAQSLPACAQTCVLQALGSANCNATDSKCICTKPSFLDSLNSCLPGACSAADIPAAQDYQQSFCSAAGFTLSAPTGSSTPVASTPTSSPPHSSPTHSSAPIFTPAPASRASSALSLGAKIGIGVAIPLVIILATIVAIYYFRSRRTQRAQQHSDTHISLPPERKSELYAGSVDSKISGPVVTKPELSTGRVILWPSELSNTMIAEVDTNPRIGKSQDTMGNSRATVSTISSQDVSGKPLTPVGSQADTATHTTTQFADSELIEEADVVVAELGLLAIRKKTLVTQANASGRRPEEVEGRKGEEYRNLTQREEIVRKRLEEIEAERRH